MSCSLKLMVFSASSHLGDYLQGYNALCICFRMWECIHTLVFQLWAWSWFWSNSGYGVYICTGKIWIFPCVSLRTWSILAFRFVIICTTACDVYVLLHKLWPFFVVILRFSVCCCFHLCPSVPEVLLQAWNNLYEVYMHNQKKNHEA